MTTTVEVGDRVFDHMSGEYREVAGMEGPSIYMTDGGVMAADEVSDGDVLLPSEKNKPRYDDVVVQLVGRDGNAFAIMGAVTNGLRKAGYKDQVDNYRNAAMSGDYDNLLRVSAGYVTVT